jgi:hypothetical protein
MAVDEEHLAPVRTSMTTTALQKMGASKTTPTEIRHGPLEMGGLNIIDLRTELGICNPEISPQRHLHRLGGWETSAHQP